MNSQRHKKHSSRQTRNNKEFYHNTDGHLLESNTDEKLQDNQMNSLKVSNRSLVKPRTTRSKRRNNSNPRKGRSESNSNSNGRAAWKKTEIKQDIDSELSSESSQSSSSERSSSTEKSERNVVSDQKRRKYKYKKMRIEVLQPDMHVIDEKAQSLTPHIGQSSKRSNNMSKQVQTSV